MSGKPCQRSPLISVTCRAVIIRSRHRLIQAVQAIEAGLQPAEKGGIMSLCIYSGGDSGFAEKEALLSYLETLDSRTFLVIVSTYYNRQNHPPIPAFCDPDQRRKGRINGIFNGCGVPVVTVFFTGAFKFFSPCVLPLVPLYLGYLSGGAEQGELYGKRGRLFVNTICFVIGISSAFFMMGLGVSAAGSFLNKNQAMVSRIGGILVILFGCTSLGFLENQSFWVQSTVSG